MSYTIEQFNKLPKWAQQEINLLRNNLLSANDKLAAFEGTTETDTYILDGSLRKPLPPKSEIEFCTGKKMEHKVRVYAHKIGGVYVNTNSYTSKQMVIIPSASNAFYITFKD